MSPADAPSSNRRLGLFALTLLGLGIFIIFTESGILRPVISKLQDGDVTVTIPNTAVTTRDASVVGDDQSEHATAANTAVSKTAAIDLSKLPHIPPSRMGTKYHEMWDLSTSTIDIPDEYRNPFNTTIGGEQGSGSERLPRPSLKILEEVIHGEKYRAEFEAVEAYMEATDPERKPTNGTTTAVSPPSCLVPDLQATRDLARRTVELRETVFPKPEKIWHRNIDKENKNKWQYKEMTLPLPILNVGFPKCGSTTIFSYLKCIGVEASHKTEGDVIYRTVKKLGNTGWEVNYAQARMQIDKEKGRGHFPQIALLDELHEGEPNSTFIMLFRPIRDWIRSTANYRLMKDRFGALEVPGMFRTPEEITAIQRDRNKIDNFFKTPLLRAYHAGEGKKFEKVVEKLKLARNHSLGFRYPMITDVQMAKWWCGHVLHIREYVKEYPSHALIELDLYDMKGSETLLHDLLKVDTDAHFARQGRNKPKKKCFAHRNKNKPK